MSKTPANTDADKLIDEEIYKTIAAITVMADGGFEDSNGFTGFSKQTLSELQLNQLCNLVHQQQQKAVREAENNLIKELVESSVPAFANDITIQQIEVILGRALKAKYDRMQELNRLDNQQSNKGSEE